MKAGWEFGRNGAVLAIAPRENAVRCRDNTSYRLLARTGDRQALQTAVSTARHMAAISTTVLITGGALA